MRPTHHRSQAPRASWTTPFRIADPVSIADGLYITTRDTNCPSCHPIYKDRDTLKAGSVDNLEVNAELTATVVEDEHADAATARVEGGLETVPEVGLVNDGKVLLDITGLGHGNKVTILHVEDSVLLEDRSEHGLNDNAGSGVRDEGALLMEGLGEEINTEVAVLASSSRGGDADHLAGAALEHEEIANADVVAGDGDSVGHSGGANLRPGSTRGAAFRAALTLDMVVVVAGLVFVVVAHFGLAGELARLNGFFAGVAGVGVSVDAARLARLYSVLFHTGGGGVLDGSVVSSLDGEGGLDTRAVLAFSNVNRAGGVVVVVVVDLNTSLGEVGSRRSELLLSVVVLSLLLDTGTAAIVFFTGEVHFFLARLVKCRRVLSFPSGLGGDERDLLVGGAGCGGCVGLGLRLAVCRWEDAEGDGDTSFKVQVCDLWVSRRSQIFQNRPFANERKTG